MTATITEASQELIDAIDDAYEDAECASCDQPATCIGTTVPCGHQWLLCTQHRVQNTRLFNLRSLSRCGRCDAIVNTLTWRPL